MVSCEPQSMHTAMGPSLKTILPNNIQTGHQPEPVTNVGLTTINVSIVVILRAWHISGSRAEPNTIKLLAWVTVYVSLLTLSVLGGMTT